MLGGVVPFQVNAYKIFSLPIFRDFIIFLENLAEVVGISPPHMFNSKILNNKEKFDWTPGLFP